MDGKYRIVYCFTVGHLKGLANEEEENFDARSAPNLTKLWMHFSS